MHADNTIIDWTKQGNTPRELIARFEDIPQQQQDSVEIAPVRTDIDVSVRRYDIGIINPLDYRIVEYKVNKKGTTDAFLNRNNVVWYLKSHYVVYDNGIPYIFNGCIYTQIDDEMVERMIYQAIDAYDMAPFPKKHDINDIIAKLRVTSTPLDIPRPDGWNADGEYDSENIIPFANGLYNMDIDELLPFTPFVFITRQLHAMYRPAITEHPVEKIYQNIIPDKDTLRFFYEMAGFSMFSPIMTPSSIFLIYGPGNTGKSALQEAVTCASGFENTSTLDLAQISGSFTTSELLGKLINVCGETGSGQSREVSKVDGELLKRLSDGQPITVQRKYGHPFQMCNTAKLWFVSNTLPDFGDTSSGLYRRLYIIPCRQEQDYDAKIKGPMQESEAISWLINKCLAGYRDFVANGRKFHVSAEMLSERSSYKKQDALMDFIEQWYGTCDKSVVVDKLNGVWVGDIYEEYKNYVLKSGGRPLSSRKFSEKIRNEFDMDADKVRTYQSNGNPTYRIRFVKAVTYR